MNLPATITLRIDFRLTKDDEGKTVITYADVSGAQPSSSFSGYQIFAPKLIGDLTLSPEHVVNKVSQRLLENIQDLLRHAND